LAKIFQDLWIMSANGVVLFSRVFAKTVDDQLFGGLMSALNAFAEELTEGGLTNFELSNKRFSIMKKNDLLFIANSALKVKDKKLRVEIAKIAEKFFLKYTENVLENWEKGGCDVSIFNNFIDDIQDALENPMKKFWNGF